MNFFYSQLAELIVRKIISEIFKMQVTSKKDGITFDKKNTILGRNLFNKNDALNHKSLTAGRKGQDHHELIFLQYLHLLFYL